MSQEIVSQKMKMTCDGCGFVQEYEQVDVTLAVLKDMSRWYILGKEAIDPVQGIVKMKRHACSLPCVPAAAVKLALPPAPPEDEIDLASLRTRDFDPSIN